MARLLQQNAHVLIVIYTASAKLLQYRFAALVLEGLAKLGMMHLLPALLGSHLSDRILSARLPVGRLPLCLLTALSQELVHVPEST